MNWNVDISSKRVRQQWLIGIALLLVIGLPFLYSAIVVPLSPAEQVRVSMALIALALVATFSGVLRPLIIFLSCFASMRYFYWRIASTITTDTFADGTVSILLLAAEIYGLLILFLGYFQTIEVQNRPFSVPSSFPSVDVFIPTYNEPIDVVRRTLIGALTIEYPNKTVYVLDDGHRTEIRAMTEHLGGVYISRPNNVGAKAGNLNYALQHTHGELIATFDADHVPVRGFLSKTVGFFDDTRVALVQTAQTFFNPDPFERNLGLTGKIPPEQRFFYHVIQPGNDFWNSAFFCGSCAVLRRSALESIGGFKTETVTEDAHTSLVLHSAGYASVYLPTPLAAGLATESYRGYVQQRMRWARGMAQILRIDCPLFKRGLTIPQRVNYFNAMLHFFFGIPRLIMILAPLSFLLFGVHPLKADVAAVMAYILPHVALSMIANSIISKNYRHSFYAAVYEVSIAPYTAAVTLLALINPRLGKFNVTEKGTNQAAARFDYETSIPTLVLLGISVLGLMVAFPLRLLLYGSHGSSPAELDAILINGIWAAANFVTLLAAACVGFERPQRRVAPRVAREFECMLLAGPEVIAGTSVDLSESGVRILTDKGREIPEEVDIVIKSSFGIDVRVTGRQVRQFARGAYTETAFGFVNVDSHAYRRIVQLMFSGDQSWTGQEYPRDGVLRSFWSLVTTYWRVSGAQYE